MSFRPLTRAPAHLVKTNTLIPKHLQQLQFTTSLRHTFTTQPTHKGKANAIPPRPTLEDSDVTKKYLKGSGPGGQKINKTTSAVQMTHLPTGIVVKSQATRSRSQNETIARRILAEKVELLEKGDQSRVALKQERKAKKKASAVKKARRKYRRLAGESGTSDVEADELYDGEDGDGVTGQEGEAEREGVEGDGSSTAASAVEHIRKST